MTQVATVPAGLGQPGPLGAIEAIRLGWRLLMSDFWRLWLLALVTNAVIAAAGMVGQCGGAVPFCGAIISVMIAMAIAVFLQPPLHSGLFFAIGRKIDGGGAKVENLFAAFRQRYWESVVAALPPMATGMVVGVVIVGVVVVGVVLVMAATDGNPERLFKGSKPAFSIAFLVIAFLILFLAILAASIVNLFFIFALLAVWDFPRQLGKSITTSMRLVKDHFWSVLGLAVLFGLIGLGMTLAAALPGGVIIGVGVASLAVWPSSIHQAPVPFIISLVIGVLLFYLLLFLIVNVLIAWYNAALIYLYRSWTGRSLVQPVAPGQPTALV